MKCYRCDHWPCECRDGQTIIHGDCREVLPLLEPVDLVLTDPPYGLGIAVKGSVGSNTTTKWKHGMREWGNQAWDKEPPSMQTIEQVMSKTRHAIVWGGNYFTLPVSSCWLVWNKCQRNFSFADGEIAWTNLPKAVRIFDFSRGSLTCEGRFHPTCKPLALMKWCIRQAPPDVATILDPFLGSGTTLRACKDLGRRGIGIEIEERYCEIAANRLRQEVLNFGE